MITKVAVIGVGSMGRNHARVNWELPDVHLVGVADRKETTVNAVAARYNTRAYTDYRQMLDKQKPDAVTIAVPTSWHQEVALEVIQRGIHLLIEKPLASSVEEAETIIHAAQMAQVHLMVGHIERFNPAVIALKQHLANNQLGRLFQVDARRQGPLPERINDVGVVVDLAVHDLDIMRYVTQAEITRIYAETQNGIHSQKEDLLSSVARLSNGTVGTLLINWITPTKIREFNVTGEGGMFKVDYLTQDLYFFENAKANGGEWESMRVLRGVSEGRMVRYHIEKREPLRVEHESFQTAVRGEAPIAVSGEDGLIALKLAHAVVESGLQHTLIQCESERPLIPTFAI